MKIEQNLFIDELVALIEQAIEATKNFKLLPEISLNYKKNSSEWSILECLEHLYLYGEFYLPEIEKQLLESSSKNQNGIFKSGIIGNYFANLMKENKGKIKRLKSPKDKDPINSNLSVTTIDSLLIQLDSLKFLLNQSRTIDLVKVKAAISLTKFIKLRLGDTLRFVVYHIERHILQAQRKQLENTQLEQRLKAKHGK
jgi:hypothetical protein